ncbi:hypothetical protein [Enterovirga sp.]|jgi:hypothetical protein|uniref:hypothetical protein n=1 Tax=Enterovirga sp. TaxID=2026350 RepID=UPI00261DE72A|nr:hypothetical protein [Enterovirga sp.]MDB5592308.1 hypothetical protein [Enterovirga sp.]
MTPVAYVLIWIALSGGGTLTSGSAEFETRAACQSAQRLLRESYMKLQAKLGEAAPNGFEAGCTEKRL